MSYLRFSYLRLMGGIAGWVLIAQSAFAQGFGELRRYEGTLEAQSSWVGMGEVKEAEARMEAEIRDRAKANLLTIAYDLQNLSSMPDNPADLQRLYVGEISSEQIRSVVITLSDGRSFVYDFGTQFKGVSKKLTYGIHD